jgi:hypothetical protein
MSIATRFKWVTSISLILFIVQSGYCTDTLRLNKLELAAKVWGFTVFKTEQHISNPDKELLKLIKLADKKESFEVYRDQIRLWSQKKLSVTKGSCNCFGDSSLPQSMRWISDTLLLGQSFSEELNAQAHFCTIKGTPQYHLKIAIPEFYRGIKIDPEKIERPYMLLGALKYWNITNYFYAYLSDCTTDWDKELPEMITGFDSLQSYKDYYMTLLLFSQKLHDGHARVFSSWAANHLFEYEIPCEAEVFENWSIITQSDSSSLLQKNDIITAINHKPILECITYWEKYLSSSTRGWFLHIVRNYLFTSGDSTMNADILRNGVPLNIDIPMVKMREKRKIENNDVYNMSSDSIGYIHLGNLQLYHIAQLKKQLQSAKVLIIDAREYPNGTFLALSPWLIDGGKIFANHNTYNTECLGSYVKDSSSTVANEPDRYPGTILFVIDRSTISQGEFMTMAFMQSTNVITLGHPTAGAIGVTSQFELPGEITCKITTSEVTLPNGSKVQQHGLYPNVNLSGNEELMTSDDLIRVAYEYARRIINFNTK